ncbi:hypothetical protein WANA13_1278 [Wolbachia endosymbiont of Drosophila ananassae]|nr:hypothetical protein WANA13_1278 [Wolbachia endosymbiont of Drosophila ananassae]
MAFFYSKRLITATQLLLNATNLSYKCLRNLLNRKKGKRNPRVASYSLSIF